MAGKGIIFVFHYFSRGGRPSSSTCCYGFVCEGEKSCLVDELDKLLWTTKWTVVVIHFCSSTQPLGLVTSVQTGDPGAAVPVVQPVQMGQGPFHCIAPSLTSLVHTAAVFMVIDTLAASLSAVLPTQPTTTHIR